jgi:hypothetical protein
MTPSFQIDNWLWLWPQRVMVMECVTCGTYTAYCSILQKFETPVLCCIRVLGALLQRTTVEMVTFIHVAFDLQWSFRLPDQQQCRAPSTTSLESQQLQQQQEHVQKKAPDCTQQQTHHIDTISTRRDIQWHTPSLKLLVVAVGAAWISSRYG